jgi:membrane protease YdiL (CAAX protease family)
MPPNRWSCIKPDRDDVDSGRKQMLSRALALVREHPLLTPLLIVYATVSLIAAIFAFGPSHFPIDLVLLAAYISAIHFATRGRPLAPTGDQVPADRSRDVGLTISVAVLQLAGVTLAWFAITHGFPAAWAAGLRAHGIPSLIAGKAAAAMLTVPLVLLPTVVAVVAFRVRARDVGLTARPRDLLLGVALAAISVGVGAADAAAGGHPGLLWQSAPLPIVTATIAFQSLLNGVPEELAFRGVIFGRLMPWLGRPGNSLAISTMAWGLYHVPLFVVGSGTPIWLAVATGLFGALSGLVFGYLFYRTRSIWPGVIWHTSITGIGLMFV